MLWGCCLGVHGTAGAVLGEALIGRLQDRTRSNKPVNNILSMGCIFRLGGITDIMGSLESRTKRAKEGGKDMVKSWLVGWWVSRQVGRSVEHINNNHRDRERTGENEKRIRR